MKNDKVNQTIIRSSKSLAADMTDIIYGKLPPQAVDLEEAVLGAFMIDRDVLRFLEELKPAALEEEGLQASGGLRAATTWAASGPPCAASCRRKPTRTAAVGR